MGYVGSHVSQRRRLKRETEIGILEEIVTRLRRPNSTPTLRRNIAVLPEGYRGEIFRFSSQAPQLRPTRHTFFSYIGGWYHGGFEVSKPGHDRGEIFVWGVNEVLEPEFIDCPLTLLEDYRAVLTYIPTHVISYLLYVCCCLFTFASGFITYSVITGTRLRLPKPLSTAEH